MLPLALARYRVDACIREIVELEDSEFPYGDPRRALSRLKGRFVRLRKEIEQTEPGADPEFVTEQCNRVLEFCVRYLPVLGFILRSTNVRNGFEVVGPLRRLAEQLLQPERKVGEFRTQLLLSSEWEYMPLFRAEAELPGYVMIGLPAHESSNPLLFPLCGHELGHALWRTKGRERESLYSSRLRDRLDSTFQNNVTWEKLRKAFPQLRQQKKPSQGDKPVQTELFETDESYQEILNTGVEWATMQAEEVFCDCTGLRLFGRAYLLAFAHLLSPGNIGRRLPGYPNLKARVEHMSKAAQAYGIPEHAVDTGVFDDRAEWDYLPSDRLLMSFSDDALKSIVDELISDVDCAAKAANICGMNEDGIKKILDSYRWVVPASGCQSLADILNAGWKVFEDAEFWARQKRIQEEKDSVLKELLLKNIELFEVEWIKTRQEN